MARFIAFLLVFVAQVFPVFGNDGHQHHDTIWKRPYFMPLHWRIPIAMTIRRTPTESRQRRSWKNYLRLNQIIRASRIT